MHQHQPNPISCKAVFLFSIVDNVAPYISVSRTLDSIPKWKPTRWPDYPHTKMLCQLANAMKSPSEILAQYLAILTTFFSYTKSYFQSFFISRTGLVLTSSYQKHLGMFLDRNLILMNILKQYLRKLVNLLALFVSSEIFYRDHPFYKSINLLLDLTQITVILSMIRLLQGIFKRNLNPFNIMQLQP